MTSRHLVLVLLLGCVSGKKLDQTSTHQRTPRAHAPTLRASYLAAHRLGGAPSASQRVRVALHAAADQPPAEAARALNVSHTRLAISVTLWWTLNVVFNLANKRCLNAWPHAWALSATHLAVGSTCMLPLYLPLPRWNPATGGWSCRPVRKLPRVTISDVSVLLPVVCLLCIGHSGSTVAPAYGTVAFSNIIKTAEPLFTCALSVLLYRRSFPLATYASLLAIVAGVSLFSANDLDFHYFSLIAGMVSNAGYAMYSIRAKAALQRLPQLSPRELFAIITLGGCAVLSPIALIFELCGAGATGVVKDPSNAIRGWKLVRLLGFTGFIQYLSNEIAFCTLPLIHPVTYAVANTMKRSLVVAVSLLFFGRSLPLRGMAGALLALSGALAYSMSMQNWRRKRPRKSATRRSHPEPITRVRAAPDSGAATVAQAF